MTSNPPPFPNQLQPVRAHIFRIKCRGILPLARKLCFKMLKLPVLCHNTNITGSSSTCQLFLRQMWWNFCLVMTEVAENIKISGSFPKTSQRWQKCPNNLFKSISEAILRATILACCADTVRTQSQH